MSSTPQLVIGCGPVGQSVIRLLSERGIPSVGASRHRPDGFLGNWIKLDASDAEAVSSAASSADVVYLCAAPGLTRWGSDFEPMVKSVLAGLRRGSTLVFAGNLFPYGDQDGVISESTQELAQGPQGRLRSRLDRMVLSAEGLSTAIVRSSSFYGPGVVTSRAGATEIKAMMDGKPVPALGSPDQPHSMTYIDDFGRALINVAHDAASHGRVWIAPVQPPISQRDLLKAIGASYGVEPKFRVASKFIVNVGGLFSPTMRALKETFYIHAKPYLVDASRYVEYFHDEATALEVSVKETLAQL
ncbi:NAD-dependent epimerase/dehydratase family protein [Actinomyces naeslundii]|uniref:NAD-dependent epimerase/dehydratase family protein n=1 Tax=Actinomyces naeslundii TaxID=1655 RepID=UPI0028ED75AD|nr:NAD-dependent epimerase/dehydratase family protein [Actinomyces naeslundii]